MTQNISQATKDAPYCKPYHPYPCPPSYNFPAKSCDTHAHICGPEASTHYDPDRIYTPPDALLPAYEHMLETLGVTRMVLVQPSVYGMDNSVMLKTMHATSLEVRGVAVLPGDIAEHDIDDLHQQGVRGVRFNLVDVKKPSGGLPLTQITSFAERIKPWRWHVEFLIHVDDYPDFETLFKDFPTDIVVGHFGYFRPETPLNNPGFQGMLRLVESGKCWVKLTGPYRISTEELPYQDVDVFGKTLIKHASHRLLWGSDWPHVMMKKSMVNDGDLADTFFRYSKDKKIIQRILVDNPAEFYQF